MQKSFVKNNTSILYVLPSFLTFVIIAVTSAMRKNGRWLNTNALQMGSLGDSMGLRSGRTNTKDSNLKEVYINICFISRRHLSKKKLKKERPFMGRIH